jgi:hypothetical protein
MKPAYIKVCQSTAMQAKISDATHTEMTEYNMLWTTKLRTSHDRAFTLEQLSPVNDYNKWHDILKVKIINAVD